MNDLLTNETGDLLIRNGDFAIGDSRANTVERILQAYPGEFKEKPLLGCNIKEQINGVPSPFWRGNATNQLQTEGINVKRLDITDTGVEIETED